MNSLLIALGAKLGVSRFDSDDAVLTEAGGKLDALLADKAALQKRVDEFPPAKKEGEEEEEKEDAPDFEAMKKERDDLKTKIDELEAKLAKKDKDEEDRKDAAELAKWQAVAPLHGIDHDGLKLDGLKRALAKTRADSVTDEMPMVAVNAILLTLDAPAPVREDNRYDFGGDGDKKRADADDEFYQPYLRGADASHSRNANTGGAR